MSAVSLGAGPTLPANYKWIVLSDTTIGMLLATINASILLIALPDIFRGIHIDPLAPGNTNYLLWMILSFLIVTAVLVVSLGRIGDIYGRVRITRISHLMSAPFSDALGTAFTFSFIACMVAAWASWLRGGKYHHREEEAVAAPQVPAPTAPAAPDHVGRPGAVTGR